MADKTTITDFEHCPHCGSDSGYYVKLRATGMTKRHLSFEDHEPSDNNELFDSILLVATSLYYYCEDCHSKICKGAH